MKKVLFGEQSISNQLIGFIELNAPSVLNSLDKDMLASIEAQMNDWGNKKNFKLLFVHSENPKAFCAGGNVKDLVLKVHSNGLNEAVDFFTQEYYTDCLFYKFKHPAIAFLDGITMGGGIGLTAGFSHKIVTEKTRLAMPEVFIGLFPDVGASRFLLEIPNYFGIYLGLTGLTISGAFAVRQGWQKYFIESRLKRKIMADLVRIDWAEDAIENKNIISDYLKSLSTPLNELKVFETESDRFIADSFSRIQSRFIQLIEKKDFETVIELVNSDLKDQRKRSYLSQVLYLQLFDKNLNQNWPTVFENEWLAAIGQCEQAYFKEGVRAVLIDKDQNPNWLNLSYKEALDLSRSILMNARKNELAIRFKNSV